MPDPRDVFNSAPFEPDGAPYRTGDDPGKVEVVSVPDHLWSSEAVDRYRARFNAGFDAAQVTAFGEVDDA